MDGARRIWKKYIECFGNLYNVITEEKVPYKIYGFDR